jgi:hypothetical protein
MARIRVAATQSAAAAQPHHARAAVGSVTDRNSRVGLVVILLLVAANIAVRFDVATLVDAADGVTSQIQRINARGPRVEDDTWNGVGAVDVLVTSTPDGANETGSAGSTSAIGRPPQAPVKVKKLPPIFADSRAARMLYDTTRGIDIHEKDFIPKAKACSVQWCKGVDKRRLASVLYDGRTDRSDTTPPITRKELSKVHAGVKVKIDGYKWGSYDLDNLNETITDLKTTPTSYVKCIKKNVAVGYAVNMLPPFIQPFISSFERYHGPCDEAILFVDDMRLAVQLDRTKGNVKFLDRTKWATKVSGAHRLSTGTQRIPVLEAWLKERWQRYHFVVHVDTRDLVFFSNAFVPLFRHNVSGLFSAGEAMPFYSSQMNRQWVNKYSGIRVMSDYISTLYLHGRNLPVICSGLYGGTSLALYDYFGGFSAAVGAASRVARDTLGIDQGIHVYLQIFGLPLSDFPHPVMLLDEGTGPMRHWYTRESTILRDGLGRHVNCEMEPYAVVHQLDRYNWAWDDVFSDYKLKQANSIPNDCRGAINETDALLPFSPDAAEAAGLVVPPMPGFLKLASSKDHRWMTLGGVVTTSAAAGPTAHGAAEPATGGDAYAPVNHARRRAAAAGSSEPRAWNVLHSDSEEAAWGSASSQVYNTVCTAHNAVLLFAHIFDPEPLQTLIAAIQRYHTICDTVVVFVPRQPDGYEALAHSGATRIIFEAFSVPNVSSTDGGPTPRPSTGPPEPTDEPEVSYTPRARLPRMNTPQPATEAPPPDTDEAERLRLRRLRPLPRMLQSHGRRLALAVIARWLHRHGGAFKYVTVIEDAVRLRVGVFDNLFTPLYQQAFHGVWLLPFLPGSTSATDTERGLFVAAARPGLTSPAAKRCLFDSTHDSAERTVVAAAHNCSVLSSVYGGETTAVFDYLQATVNALEAMDRRAEGPVGEGTPQDPLTTPQCSADPDVLEALRAHLLPAALMRASHGFPHDVVILDDRHGPHRHVLGLTLNFLESGDRFGRSLRCDRHRTPHGLLVGFAAEGPGGEAYRFYQGQYKRRGEEARQSGFEAYFETHVSNKLCH